MFIYIGVACIGLLLGSYIAGMMDDRAIRERKENQIDSCPNCERIRSFQESTKRNAGTRSRSIAPDMDIDAPKLHRYASERCSTGPDLAGRAAVYLPSHHRHRHYDSIPISRSGDSQKSAKNIVTCAGPPPPPPPTYMPIYELDEASRTITSYRPESSPDFSALSASPSLGSPVTRNILVRQRHTRHASFDVCNNTSLLGGAMPTYGTAEVRVRTFSEDYRGPSTTIEQLGENHSSRRLRRIQSGATLGDNLSDYSDEEEDEPGSFDEESESTVYSTETESSVEELWDTTKAKIQVAKYIFLTLRLALFNSLVIIAVGCVGFWLIEGFTLIDGWYFTTVLLTTVG